MKRFRFTFLAICLVLIFLGGRDVLLWQRNPVPQSISIEMLEKNGAPREWMHIPDGYQDLDRAISTSGSIDMEALLVPVLSSVDQEKIGIIVETRNPHLLELFQEYHFSLDTLPEKRSFRREHAKEFRGKRPLTGMLVSGLIAKGNRQKLIKLAKETGLEVDQDVIFISEGKAPGKWRGIFFVSIGFLGLLRVLFLMRQKQQS